LDPSGIAVGGGKVFVADGGRHRIYVFDTNGNFITKWGSAGSGEGEFSGNSPRGIAVSTRDEPVVSACSDPIAPAPDQTPIVSPTGMPTTEPSPSPSPSIEPTSSTPPAIYDLEVDKAAFIEPGASQGYYSIRLDNHGPGDAGGPMVVRDYLPPGVTYAPPPSGANWTCVLGVTTASGEQEIVCTYSATINAGGTAPELHIPVTLVSSANWPGDPANVENCAVLEPGDADPDNNRVCITTSLVAPISSDLTIQKSSVGTLYFGSLGGYGLTVTNLGPDPVSAPITVVDDLPAGMVYSSAAGNGWQCTAGPLPSPPAGQQVTCTYGAGVAPNGFTDTLTLNVSIPSSQDWPHLANLAANCAEVQAIDILTSNNEACIVDFLQ
jgi:uncharacterized repeat protein (TIGR01451 family)